VVGRLVGRGRRSIGLVLGFLGQHPLGGLMLRGARGRPGSHAAVWILTAALFAGSALLWFGVRGEEPPFAGGPTLPLWVLAVSFGVAEVFVMHIRIARHAQTFSLAEIPLVFGLAFTTPGGLVLAQAVGVGIALAVHRRQKPLRLTFNVAQRGFTTLLAVVFVAVCRSALPDGWPSLWVSFFGATLLADLVGAMLINVAIGLSDDKINLLDQVIGLGTSLTVANTALGIVGVMVFLQEPAAVLLVVAPAATTYLAGKAFTDLQRKHDDLLQLQRATGLAQRSLEREDMVPVLLHHMREMFNADIAELLLWPEGRDQTPVRCQVGPGDEEIAFEPVSLDPTEGVWARVASERESVLLSRPIRNEALRRFFGDRQIRDAIVAPVSSDDQLLGILTVADRLDDFSTFDHDDLELFQTLTNHVAVALRNSLLLERLERALAHETETSRLKDEFVATVSHELRTPLTNVQGFVKTLLRRDVRFTPAEQHEFLLAADRHTERLKRLIEDILFAARVETDERLARPTQEIGLAGLITRLVEDEAYGDGRRRIDVVISDTVPPVLGIEEDVYRILRNLIDNALKYSPASQRVTVTVGVDVDDVVVRVHDRGPGIAPEQRDRIFDRFYQVDQSDTRRVGGVGMGLYICRRAAERLGARIWLDRSDASGSVFAVRLPTADRTGHETADVVTVIASV
jgi:signal transduction histidine kinase